MAGNGKNTNSESFISDFESKKSDGLVSNEEKTLKELFFNLPKAEQEKVFDKYKDISGQPEKAFIDGLKKDLQNLKDDVEGYKEGPFSMETISKNSDSKSLNIVLGNPGYVKAYEIGIIGSKIEGSKELFGEGHDTLNVVYWKKIIDEIGIKSTGSFAMSAIGGVFENMIGKLSNIGEKAGDMKPESFSIKDFGKIVEDLKELGNGVETKESKEQLGGLIGKLKGYIDFLTKGYDDNLKKLLEIGKSHTNKEGLKSLLDNPVVLSEVLEKGVYKGDGYDIDLSKDKVVLSSSADIDKSKKDFMKLVVNSNNENGGIIDGLKEKTKEIGGFFKTLGFDSSTLRDFRDGLKEIPIIGAFLYELMNFFLGDDVLDQMDGDFWSKSYKTTGENLNTFLTNKDKNKNTPFKIEESMLENEDNIESIEGFLKIVDDFDKINHNNIQNNKKILLDEKAQKTFKEEKRSPLINESKFWETIFSDKPSDNKILEKIRKKSVELKDKKLSAKEFFIELSKVEIKVVGKKSMPTEDELILKRLKEEKAKIINKEDISDLSLKIENIDKIPTKITLDNKKELDIDFKDSKLLLGDKEFVLEEGDLSEIKFDTENVILKLKDNTEKKLTKSDFAGILAGLAVGEQVVNSIFVTQEEKKVLLDEKKKKEKEEKVNNLNNELNILNKEIPLLISSITIIINDLTELKGKIKDDVKKLKTKEKEKKDLLEKIENNKKTIFDNQGEINKLDDQLEDSTFWNVLGSRDELKKKVDYERSTRDLNRKNIKHNNDIKLIDEQINILNSGIERLGKEKDKKQANLDEQTDVLNTKNSRAVEIGKDFGNNIVNSKKPITTSAKGEKQSTKQNVKLVKEEILDDKIAKAQAKVDANNKFENSIKNIKSLPDTIEYEGRQVKLDIKNNEIILGEKSYKISVNYAGEQKKVFGKNVGPAKGENIFEKINFQDGKLTIITKYGGGPLKTSKLDTIIDSNKLIGAIKSLLVKNSFEDNIVDDKGDIDAEIKIA